MLFAQADGNKGQIVGTVYDPNQAAVPGATVKVRNTGTGLERELKSNETGQYRAVLLDPGTYQVTATSSGFAETKIDGIPLSVGAAINIDINLNVQSTSTTVDVGDTLINVALPAPTATVNSAAITNLPINGRRFQDFATLTPSVQFTTETRGQLSFVGQRGIYANISLDGSDYSAPFFGGIRGGERSGFAFTVPQAAIQEFQVITQGYSAEYGRSTGGIMNAITKSGTNGLHGEAFYQNRNKELSKNTAIPFRDPRVGNALVNGPNPENLQQFGGGIGGPIKSDRVFFFGAAERQLSRIDRQVVFPNLSGIAATAATQEAFNYYTGLQVPYQATNDAYAVTGRLDMQNAKGNRLTLRYNTSGNNATNAVSVGGATTPTTNAALSNEGIEKNHTHTGTAQYTHILSPTTLWDTRFSWQFEDRPREANDLIPTVSNVIGTYGTRNFLPTTQEDTRQQILSSLTVNRGYHTVKTGIDFSRLATSQLFGFNQFGAFSFATGGAIPAQVGNIMEVMSRGGTIANRFDAPCNPAVVCVTFNRQIGNLLADFGAKQFAFFVQDSWRVRPNLTLDLGLRYEGQWNPKNDASNTTVANLVKNTVFPNGARLDPSQLRNNLNQVMPRFGFSYTPFARTPSKMVIRGNAGIFYAATPLIVFASGTNNFRATPGDVSIAFGNDAANPRTLYQSFLAAGVDLNTFTLDKLPAITVEQLNRAAAFYSGGSTPDPFRNANLTTTANDFSNPRAFQAGLGFESEVFKNFVAGVQLNYVNTVNLLRNRDYNAPAVSSVRATDGRPQFVGRAIPSLNQITVRESSARSMYRGMTIQAQYRFSRFQFASYYTVSDTFSDDDSERDAGGFTYDNPYRLDLDYGRSLLDVRHQFTSNALVRLPLGLEVSGIFRARSGYPINPSAGTDANADRSNSDRAYKAVGVPFERNAFRNRGIINNNDLRIMKSFSFRDRFRVQVSAEFFNLFNLDNVEIFGTNRNYGTTPGTPLATFLTLKSADGRYDPNNRQVGNPFQTQLGVRFFF
ncbi:MAG: TonB-dependent receptor [Bryobacterales bacterium]|nr:TonB-dependent receptor [Bryobacterales bacterium]